MPKVRWFANQREALGLEAVVYAFMAVGKIRTVTLSLFLFPNLSFTLTLTLSRTLPLGACDEVVQWGFDETTLDGTSCFNQWCLLRTGKIHVLCLSVPCMPGCLCLPQPVCWFRLFSLQVMNLVKLLL